MIIYPALQPYIEQYTNLDFEPLQIEVVFNTRHIGYDSLHLDGLLSKAVVRDATSTGELPPSAEPYNLPLPLKCLWRHPVSNLPLWASTDFRPLDTNEIDIHFWHKRSTSPEMLKRNKNDDVANVFSTKGRLKEMRIPSPQQRATVWRATCYGNLAEIKRLFSNGLMPGAIGKKHAQGRGIIRHWLIRPIERFSIYDEAGRLLRPVPVQFFEQFDIKAPMLGWTPPYWLSACQQPCLWTAQAGLLGGRHNCDAPERDQPG